MQTQITISYTPEEFEAFVTRLVSPLTEQIKQLQDQVSADQDFYTVQQIADRAAVSVDLVRDWIRTGRKVPGKNKVVRLLITEGLTDKNFRISRQAWADFKGHFSDVKPASARPLIKPLQAA